MEERLTGGLVASKGQGLPLMPHCLLKCVCTRMDASMLVCASECVCVCMCKEHTCVDMGTTWTDRDRTEALAREAMVNVPRLLMEEDGHADAGMFTFCPESRSRLRVRNERKELVSRQGGQPSGGDWKPLS